VKVTIRKTSILIQGQKVDTAHVHAKISDIFRHVQVADVKKLQQSLISQTVKTLDTSDMVRLRELVKVKGYFIISPMNWLVMLKDAVNMNHS